MSQSTPLPEPSEDSHGAAMRLTFAIQAILAVCLVLFVLRRDWENVFLTVLVIALTLAPALVWRRYRLFIPPEFQLVSAAFIFLSLFLGSAVDLYYRLWWWDVVLHTGSGFLLGMVGFLALFVLNRTNQLPQGIRPGFVCFFGVTFAVFLGVVWEIFEFVVDSFAPAVNMQSNETGVADTMMDLIVDTIGAVIVGLMGWAYLRRGRYSFLADALRGFLRGNPQLFDQPAKNANSEPAPPVPPPRQDR